MTLLKHILKDKELLLSIGFAVFLAVYEKLIFRAALYPFPDTPGFAFYAEMLSCAAIVLFFWAAFTSTPRLRWIYFLLFCVATLTEYGYRFAMGRFSVTEDYRAGLQSLNFDWFKNAAITFLGGKWPVVLPILIFGELLIWTSKKRQGGLGRLVGALITIILLFSCLYPFSRGTFSTVSLAAFWRTLIFTSWRTATVYQGGRLKIALPKSDHPKNNIVFIIDESIRGDHLSVNGYLRKTTPYLDELKNRGFLHTWGIATAAATTSLSSNAVLLTGVNQLPDVTQEIYRLPTIFTYAKAMGYRTYYLDLQMDRLWLMTQEDMDYLDVWQPAKDFSDCPSYEVDLCAAQSILETIENSSGNFIWVNKLGAHFPYGARLPAGFGIWEPMPKNYEYAAATKEEIINVYDNVIAYNLEGFFRRMITPQTLRNTTFIYTSDHGQTLSENGETWPHSGPTRNEAVVPILMIRKEPLIVDNGYKASHHNLFPTLLTLMNVPETARMYPYSLSLLHARVSDSVERFYLVGDINSQRRSLLLPFDTEK